MKPSNSRRLRKRKKIEKVFLFERLDLVDCQDCDLEYVGRHGRTVMTSHGKENGHTVVLEEFRGFCAEYGSPWNNPRKKVEDDAAP